MGPPVSPVSRGLRGIVMQLGEPACDEPLRQRAELMAIPTPRDPLARPLRLIKAVVFCSAGHPPPTSVFRHAPVRSAFFVAMLILRAINLAHVASSRSQATPVARLNAAAAFVVGVLDLAIVAVSPLLVLREVRPCALQARSWPVVLVMPASSCPRRRACSAGGVLCQPRAR